MRVIASLFEYTHPLTSFFILLPTVDKSHHCSPPQLCFLCGLTCESCYMQFRWQEDALREELRAARVANHELQAQVWWSIHNWQQQHHNTSYCFLFHLVIRWRGFRSQQKFLNVESPTRNHELQKRTKRESLCRVINEVLHMMIWVTDFIKGVMVQYESTAKCPL